MDTVDGTFNTFVLNASVNLFDMVSMGIESVVNEKNGKASNGLHDTMCSVCEMAVVWIQNKLGQNETLDFILKYVNEVKVT